MYEHHCRRGGSARVELGGEVGGEVLVAGGAGVGVDAEGGGDLGVPGPVCDDAGVEAGFGEGGDHGVAQVVEPHAVEPDVVREGPPAVRDGVGPPGDGAAVVAGEQEAGGGQALPGRGNGSESFTFLGVDGAFAAFVGDLSGESVHERLSDPPLQVSVQRMVPDGRRGPGRPAIGGRVSVNLGDDLLAELDRIAQVQGMERSELIRQLLDAALARL